jgi:hypothetical protein
VKSFSHIFAVLYPESAIPVFQLFVVLYSAKMQGDYFRLLWGARLTRNSTVLPVLGAYVSDEENFVSEYLGKEIYHTRFLRVRSCRMVMYSLTTLNIPGARAMMNISSCAIATKSSAFKRYVASSVHDFLKEHRFLPVDISATAGIFYKNEH